MGNFNRGDRGNKFGGKRRFDNDRGFRKGERSERTEMHRAVCADCGKDCEVPFRPSGDKPVYCSNCFGKKEDSGGGIRFERRSFDRPIFGDKPMFKAVCDKCHKDCEVPFRPSGDKPVYCSDCFVRTDKVSVSGNSAGTEQYKKQFEMLNSKLDSILKMLSSKSSFEKISKAEKLNIKAIEKKIEPKKVLAPKKFATSKKTIAPKKSSAKFVAKKKGKR